MIKTFNVLNIQHSDSNIVNVVNILLTTYLTNRKYKFEMIEKFKTKIIDFLYIYGFPKKSLITLNPKVENAIRDFANNVINGCKMVILNQGYKECVTAQLNLSFKDFIDYKNKILNNYIFDEIIKISYQPENEYELVIKIIIEKITYFLDYEIENYSNIANGIEINFIEIKNECLKLNDNINIKNCVKPRIKEIYEFLPYNFYETKEWVVDKFMEQFPNSSNKIDMLLKIILKLSIKSPKNSRLRLLSDSSNYAQALCGWFSILFSFDMDYCSDL